MDLYKKYVDVIAMHRKSGKMMPMYICWEDGRKYKVDQVLNFASYAQTIYISAKTGQRVNRLFETIDTVIQNQNLIQNRSKKNLYSQQ